MSYRLSTAAFFFVPSSAFAQTGFHSRSPFLPDSNTAALRFERNVNTYLWNADAAYRYNDSAQFVALSEKFTSSFIRSQFSSFRDEQNISLSASKKISEPFSLAIESQSFVLSDKQTLGSSNAGIHSGVMGITYRPERNISITPLLGMRYDKQQRETDDGPNYRLYANADSLDIGGYRAEVSGHLNQSDLGRRYFKNDSAGVNIATRFAQGSTDSIRVHWMHNQSDFYIAAADTVKSVFGVSSNIRSRIEQLYGVENILAYDVGEGFGTEFTVNVESRTIKNAFRYNVLSDPSSVSFNTAVKEFNIEGGMKLNYAAPSTLASLGFRIAERDEKHLLEKFAGMDNTVQENRSRQESRLDNTAFRTMISVNVFSDISSADQLSFLSSASILRYDTPDSVNTDDRDELLINLSLKETHRFSSVFSASLTAEVTIAHLVYLLRDKSANNNRNRIFRLTPDMTYRPSENFRMFNAFEVLANYTVFDFESLIPTVKSYSYRQVAFLDSTSYDMTKRVGVDIVANVRIFERGELHWQEFSERPLQRIEEVTFSPQIRYSWQERLTFAFGFRSFAQKKFRYVNNVRQFESTFLSAGPTTSIAIHLSPFSQIEIRGWKEFQHQSGGRVQEYSNMSMNVRYYF
jgi:hypothetical protein